MTIKQFIEKAIEGGWEAWGHCTDSCPEKATFEVSVDGKTMVAHEDTSFAANAHDQVAYPTSDMLLDPLAWKAVVKVEGWAIHEEYDSDGNCKPGTEHIQRMHRMIDALAEGKTIEDYLKTLVCHS